MRRVFSSVVMAGGSGGSACSSPCVLLSLASRNYSPKVPSLDRGLDELVADRRSIYARERRIKGKTIFPNQVLEAPKEAPTPLLQRMQMDREHEEDSRNSRTAMRMMGGGDSEGMTMTSSTSPDSVETWCRKLAAVHQRKGGKKPHEVPSPSALLIPAKMMLKSALRCVLSPVGSQAALGYKAHDVLWSWVLVLALQEECIALLGTLQDTPARLVEALEASLTAESILMTDIQQRGITVDTAVPMAYLLSYTSPSINTSIGCPKFENRSELYEHCKMVARSEAQPGAQVLPRHPLGLVALVSCFAAKSNKQDAKDSISAHVLAQLRLLTHISDPDEKNVLLLHSAHFPKLALHIQSSLEALGVSPQRSLPLLANLCSTVGPAADEQPYLALVSKMLRCEDTSEAGQRLLRSILSTRVRPSTRTLLNLLGAMEEIPRSAESDALVLSVLRRFIVMDMPFTIDDCKTVYKAAWRVGEIPTSLFTTVEREWTKDPSSSTSIQRLRQLLD